MDWITLITTIGGFISSLSVVELFKYWMSRKAQTRKEEASAEQEEIQAEQMKVQVEQMKVQVEQMEVQVKQDEWQLYKDMLHSLQEGLLKKDEIIATKDTLYSEQTKRLRKLQDEFFELSKELNKEIKKNAKLNYDYLYADLWPCEIGKCKRRKPPKPQLQEIEFDEKIILPINEETK